MLHYKLRFLQCDWQMENSLQKVIKVIKARGIGQTSPDPLLAGGVWARDYGRVWFSLIVSKCMIEYSRVLVVPDPGKPGHCPGKILVNGGYCLRKLVAAPLRASPARVTWQR